MGIYRTLLEEEIAHLDDNNDGYKETEEVIDAIVNDADANAEEQQQGAEAAFGPDDNVENIVDESFFMIAESEQAWRGFMHNLGVAELQEAAMGREMIYESGRISDWFEKAKKSITDFFKKVWQVIQRWAGNLFAMARTNKSFADKYASRISDGAKLYDKADKKLKGYSFEGIAGEKWRTGVDTLKSAASDMNGAAKEFKSAINGLSTDDKGKIGIDTNKFNDDMFELDNIPGYKNGEVNFDELRDEIHKQFRGSEDPIDDYKMDPAEIIKVLKNESDHRKKANETMKQAKEEYKKALDTLKSAETAINNKTKKDEAAKDALLKVAVSLNKVIRTCMSANQVIRSCLLSDMSAYLRQARRYGNYYVQLANKGKYKGFQKESAGYGYLSSLNLI